MSSRSAIALSSVLVALLALVAGPAAALGLGQLEVKSRPGQPLVAEIPIISNDPSELQGLRVQLAPPETFTRVGLEPPAAGVSSLRFEPTVDAAGRPVIRVTSAQPVPAPLLTFLLQVDWSQGRLVREYSALLDTPNTVAASAPPPIEAPSAAPANVIPRAPVAMQPPPAPVPVPAPTPLQRTQLPPPVQRAPVAPAPVSTPAPAPELAAAPPPVDVSPDRTAPVKAGQTLGQIVSDLQLPGRHSSAQVMLALLRDNPGAFIGGNVNLLRQGAVLRIPDAASLAGVDRDAAAAAIHEQIVQWRSSQVPRAQAIASSAATADAPKDVAKAPANRPARTLGARLEIAPSSAAGRRRAGTQSGIEAGGEGEMLRQQLQETKETLAARDAEVGELKTRVAELEKLQQQQQQLLTMKDSALAAAQQTLAKSNQASAPVATQAPVQPVPPASAGSGAIWLWSGLALVVVALVGWLLTRRKGAAQPRRAFDTAALAAGIPAARADVVKSARDPEPAPDFMPDQLVSPRPMQPAGSARDPGAPIVPPPWHGGGADTATVEPSTRATINQQLEAAQTCLAQGDDEAARVLLREVMDGRDPAAREVAARLLRDL